MCGIYGQVSLRKDIDVGCVTHARDRLAHRGPDDAGLWLSEDHRVALGHRRLSIIDLSPAGHQPMLSACGRYVITFNGEIYNYLELREELEKLGERFHGDSDTEVILASYRQWGQHCLERFNGMFAFAIYDSGTDTEPRRMFIARDRAGKKPFYYRHTDDQFEFASELKAIGGPRSLDARALNYYLALGYIPGNLCIIEGVAKLPPGHAGYFDLANGRLHLRRYWSLPKSTAEGIDDGEILADQAEALLRDAVRLRLRSDVPVGVLLSGGLDSGLVAAVAAQTSTTRIKTFTIGLPGTSFDETERAQRVADHLGSEHHVLPISQPALSVIDELASLLDEPLADSSLIPAYMVSKLTVQHVKVALGGDGGDELFGGYPVYSVAFRDQARFGWIPKGVLQMAARLAGALPAGVRGRNRIQALRGGAFQSLIWGSPYFDVPLRRRILHPDWVAKLGPDLDEPERWLLGLFEEGHDPLDSMTRTHFNSILPDDFLVKVDRASMAVSLEMRSPLLDYRLVEFAFREIPSQWKVLADQTRRIQRILARRLLPPDFDSSRKQGFSIPVDDWLRKSGCKEVNDSLAKLPSSICRHEVRALVNGHVKGRANGARLYALIVLGIVTENLALKS